MSAVGNSSLKKGKKNKSAVNTFYNTHTLHFIIKIYSITIFVITITIQEFSHIFFFIWSSKIRFHVSIFRTDTFRRHQNRVVSSCYGNNSIRLYIIDLGKKPRNSPGRGIGLLIDWTEAMYRLTFLFSSQFDFSLRKKTSEMVTWSIRKGNSGFPAINTH